MIMNEIDKALLRAMIMGGGVVANSDLDRERLDRLVGLSLATLVQRDPAPFGRSMPPMYQITDLGRAALQTSN
jgi:hypothetical protein